MLLDQTSIDESIAQTLESNHGTIGNGVERLASLNAEGLSNLVKRRWI